MTENEDILRGSQARAAILATVLKDINNTVPFYTSFQKQGKLLPTVQTIKDRLAALLDSALLGSLKLLQSRYETDRSFCVQVYRITSQLPRNYSRTVNMALQFLEQARQQPDRAGDFLQAAKEWTNKLRASEWDIQHAYGKAPPPTGQAA